MITYEYAIFECFETMIFKYKLEFVIVEWEEDDFECLFFNLN
jgi:hypothetical protein